MLNVLEKGRPEDLDQRLDKEVKVYDLLDQLGMDYYRVDHEEAHTMEECKEIDEILEAPVCKNLFLTNRQHTVHYLLLMPADKPFKTKEITSQIGSSRLSFATGEEMEEYLGCTPGSASVLGLMNDPEGKVGLLVDEDVLKEEFLGAHPCINTSSLKMITKEVTDVFLKAVNHEMTVVTLIGE